MSTTAPNDRRPEWLRRKHGKQRTEPYLDLLASAPRCHAAGDGDHQRSIIIRTVHDLDGAEHPIADENEARNVSNALYGSRPRDENGVLLVSLPRPERVQLADGAWEIRACVHDKTAGDAFIKANPNRKIYDPAQRTAAAMARPGRRRRPTKRDVEEAARREANRQHYEQELETAPVGGDMDMGIYQLDHGHREPATPAEKRRKTRVDAALKTRQAKPAGTPKPATAAERLRAILKG